MQIMQRDGGGGVFGKIEVLRFPGLAQGQDLVLTIRKSKDGGVPPAVVGEIGPQDDPDPIENDRPAQFHGQSSVGILVDAPGQVGVFAVEIAGPDAVNGVLSKESRVVAGFHVSVGMGEDTVACGWSWGFKAQSR